MTKPQARTFTIRSALVALAGAVLLCAPTVAEAKPRAAITAGNLVIYRVGTGSGALANTATAVSLDEYTTGGGLVQSIAVPSTGASALTAVGTATTEGTLSATQNASRLVFTGYRKDAGGTNPSSDSYTTTPRVIGTLKPDGTLDTTTTLTSDGGSATANSIRSATSVDGTSAFWTATSARVGYNNTPFASGGTTQIDARNSRQTLVRGNTLYASNGAAITTKVQHYGTLPTSATAGTPVVSLTTGDAVHGMEFFDLSAGVAGVDTLYVLSTAEGLVRKYTYDGTSWISTGSVSVGVAYQNLTGVATGGSVKLYLTSSTTLAGLTDASGYGAMMTGALGTIATAPTNTAFRGLAIAPGNSLSINDVSQAETNAGTTTFSFTVSLSQPAPAGGVTFDIATADNTATDADNDYEIKSLTTQTIPQNQTSYTFDVTVNGDATVESTESFFVNVTNVTGATVSDGQGTGTITNDDSPPTPSLSINDVTQAEGNAGTTAFTFTVSLSQPAGAGGVTFDIATQDNTATDADNDYEIKSLTGQTIAQGNQQYMFTVDVNGDTTPETNETFFVNVTNVTGATVSDGQGTGTITNDDVTLTLIHDIQGATHISPMNGTSRSVRGIVTGKRSNGFYMQEENGDADSDDATSEGIFVFTSSAPTSAVGDNVTVTGTVTEFRPGGSGSANLTTTELTSPVIVTNSSGNSMPTSVVIGSGGRVPPSMVIEDDSSADIETGNTFDPASDGIDFYESLEGMLAQVNNPVAVGPTTFGEIPVLADDGAGASVRTTRGGIVVRSNDFNPERIFLDDEILLVSAGSMPLANVSDHLAGSVTGIFDYSFGNFKLELTSSPTLVVGSLAQEVTATPAANEISIGTFNVENLDPGDGAAKFNALAAIVVNNLKSPDIIALEEIQDNDGATNSTTTDASTTYNTLISAITSAGGPTYAFTQIDPVDDQDGGEPGGNIRVGFLYRTDRGVSFVSKPGATPTTPNSVNAGGLVYSPGRIDPTNAAFTNSRKPLAAEFMWNTQKLYLIANHWNSKGGDDPLFGRFQPPVQSSQTQRNAQAAIVNQFVDDIIANDPSPQIVVLGDFNDFEFSGPLNTLTANGTVLHDLYYWIPQAERYSYVFDGNSQALDHILVSTEAASRGPLYDVVHVNSEFANPVTDHEPQVLRYDPLNQPTTAVEVAGLSAERTKAGVVVRWRTGNESRIAGFNVYRQRGGKLVRVNAKLIRAKAAGKAVGRAYAWRDALAKPGARYRLQVVRLDGTRAWRGSARS